MLQGNIPPVCRSQMIPSAIPMEERAPGHLGAERSPALPAPGWGSRAGFPALIATCVGWHRRSVGREALAGALPPPHGISAGIRPCLEEKEPLARAGVV